MPNAGTSQVGAAEVRVNGVPLRVEEYETLVDIRIEQSVHVPDRFSLRFRDPTFTLLDADRFAIGDSVDVACSNGDDEAVVARGEITSIGAEQSPLGRHEIVVSGLDRGHRLARGATRRTFLSMTDPQVAQKIGNERGLTVNVDSSAVSHEYLLQRSSDYAFLTERARAIGFDWWVDGETLHFKRDASAGSGPTLSYGDNLLRFKVRASCAEAASSVEVRAWNPDTQQTIVGTAGMGQGADGVLLGTTAALADAIVKSTSRFGSTTRRSTSGVRDEAEADALARALATSATSEYVVARGEALGDPRIKAGTEVDVQGVGSKLAGRYLLTSVEHILGERQYVTRFVSGSRQPDSLVDLLGGQRAATGWGELGVVIGVVTNNRDPENMGRVKVRFPTLTDTDESWWARVAATGAGSARGFNVLFEVDDEVLVVFEHGDLRRPIVLGGLWSKKNKPIETGNAVDDKGVASRVWRSRTGHTVMMYDSATASASFVAIDLADGKTKLRMGEDKVTLDSPTDVAITSDANVSIKAKGDVSIEGANIRLKAQQGASVEAAKINSKASTGLSLEGADVQVKGSAQVNVEGGAAASVRAAVVKLN